jgi:glycosyltransferase involved in cell wall biosynthesis
MRKAQDGSIASLFLLHVGSNAGYAIGPLEKLFAEIGLILGGGDPAAVHFAYPSLQRGRPRAIPERITNILEFDFKRGDAESIRFLENYVRRNEIRLVLGFDMPLVLPLFPGLRRGGVNTILCYWGAPVSSENPFWKLALKRAMFALRRVKADGVIFESHAMARSAIYGYGAPRRMVDVVPLGVAIERFCPADSDYAHQQFGFPRGRKIIVYSGHMEPRKGVRSLIEAAMFLLLERRRSDVCFLLCGNRENESRPYEAMYAGAGIDNLIRFAGYRSDMAQIFPSCFCGVIPSVGWDSFTTSSLEMASCGLPVIASRLQGLAEAVADRQTGLLYEPGNVAELADCLELLLDNPDLARQYGRAGRLRCETELNANLHRERFLSVVRKRLGLTSS